MGRCANKNSPAKGFSHLEIAGTQSTTRLGLHRSVDVIFGGQGPGLPNLKLAKLKIWCFGQNRQIYWLPNFPTIQ